MKFDRIRLTNFKPYGDADLELTDGVTVIHGLNGSGKSSLLEACFFALYGSKALDGTLDDVITNGEEEAEIDLWFTHDGISYHVERRLRAYDDRVDHRCRLETTAGGDVTRDGATAVRRFVTDLLRMDADAFVNCAYVRQGEVNALINATPGQRQDVIDDLLQLGKLEEYRERAADARLGVEDVRNAKRAVLEETDRRIEEKEEADLHGRLNGLRSERNELNERVENYETQRRKAKTTRDEAATILEEHAEKRAELDGVETDVSELETAVREAERKREELRSEIADARDRLAELEAEIDDRLEPAGLDAATEAAIAERREALEERETAIRETLDEARVAVETASDRAETLAETAEERGDRADAAAERAEELAAEAAAAEDEADEREASLTELHREADELRERFATADIDVERGEAAPRRTERREERSDARERVAELETELRNARERVDEAEELLAAGKCPECGQPVEDSPHADRIEADRERVAELEAELEAARGRETDLAERIEALDPLVAAEERLAKIDETAGMLEERIAEKREEAAAKRTDADEKCEEAEGLRREATATRERADGKRGEAAEARDRVTALEGDIGAVEDARERVSAVEDRLEEVAEVEARIERLRERRKSIDDVNDERRERLTEKRERRDELREAVDEAAVEDARERKSDAEEYLEQVEGELDRLDDRRTELQSEIGGVKGEIAALEELRTEREELAETVAALEAVHEETAGLESTYGDLRAELRQRNVRELERTLNETFELVYGNDAYSHIELDGEYSLTVYQKDGQALDPEQLSGGERALFNLSLRCAIYRLLAEGIEGAAPTPPLVLDEPTVFLDAGHVSRLVDLVEEMRGFGVRQIVIVSHDDELVGAADELVTVEKDPRTNRSTVVRKDASETDIASLADD